MCSRPQCKELQEAHTAAPQCIMLQRNIVGSISGHTVIHQQGLSYGGSASGCGRTAAHWPLQCISAGSVRQRLLLLLLWPAPAGGNAAMSRVVGLECCAEWLPCAQCYLMTAVRLSSQ